MGTLTMHDIKMRVISTRQSPNRLNRPALSHPGSESPPSYHSDDDRSSPHPAARPTPVAQTQSIKSHTLKRSLDDNTSSASGDSSHPPSSQRPRTHPSPTLTRSTHEPTSSSPAFEPTSTPSPDAEPDPIAPFLAHYDGLKTRVRELTAQLAADRQSIDRLEKALEEVQAAREVSERGMREAAVEEAKLRGLLLERDVQLKEQKEEHEKAAKEARDEINGVFVKRFKTA